MKIDVISKRMYFFVMSTIAMLLSVWAILFWNPNFWIDMTWGTQAEFSYQNYSFDPDKLWIIAKEVRDNINASDNFITDTSVYKVTGEDVFIVETWFSRKFLDTKIEEVKIAYRDALSEKYSKIWDLSLLRYTNIWASFWDYIKNTAKVTLLVAIIAIALYIGYSFSKSAAGISSLSFAAITIVTLLHDVLLAAGAYILAGVFFPQFQIDTFFITALLTILWYSINDTIVIFDRVRSNLREHAWRGKDLREIITLSVNQSITRSIYTSMTLLFVLVCMLILGPASMGWFTLTLIFGTIVGTFSSLFIAAPLLYEIYKNTILEKYEEKDKLSVEDKLVV